MLRDSARAFTSPFLSRRIRNKWRSGKMIAQNCAQYFLSFHIFLAFLATASESARSIYIMHSYYALLVDLSR